MVNFLVALFQRFRVNGSVLELISLLKWNPQINLARTAYTKTRKYKNKAEWRRRQFSRHHKYLNTEKSPRGQAESDIAFNSSASLGSSNLPTQTDLVKLIQQNPTLHQHGLPNQSSARPNSPSIEPSHAAAIDLHYHSSTEGEIRGSTAFDGKAPWNWSERQHRENG